MQFPTVDGHFWVVRNGEIIDPIFEQYKMICKIRNADWRHRNYVPAPEMTQKIMIGMYNKVMDYWTSSDNGLCLQLLGYYLGKREVNNCYQNALLEISENGGELVFGSLGFKLNNKSGYWYEFGGENWTKCKEFIKN